MSASSRKAHTRKVRRQQNAAVRWGWSAKPHHTSKSGRTGSVREKQLKGLRPKDGLPPKTDSESPSPKPGQSGRVPGEELAAETGTSDD